ncbi:MAG: DNA polymerase/3'-5' exonuclease PolX [Phycisphaeraceae bacterium]|nr:DNA polymerase/3'-5' exonuclease PolX [Phycisphaeraceae bacterium]
MAGPNEKLADIFQQMADLLLILGANRFRVIAFENAARTIGELADDVATMTPENIAQLPGVGKGTAERIAEFLDTGKIADHQDLLKQVPPGLLDLLDIPGVGPKSVAQLWHEAEVSDIATLKKKIESGELEQLKGFGAKKVENIKKNLAFAQSADQRMRIGAALPIAQWFVEQLRHIKGVKEAAYAGSLRRGRETIGDLDLLVSCSRKDAPTIRDAFLKLELVKDVLAKGDTKCSIRTPQGMQVDLRLVEPDSYGAAMLYFTGSKEHNVALRELALSKGWTLNEYRLAEKADESKIVAGKTEQEIYKKLGLSWIPPELREDRDEIKLAAQHQLPELITLKDIHAELHAHTTASDGRWSIRQLAAAAADRGFHTVAITDHSKGQVQANGLSAERLEQHIQDIRDVADQMKKTITVLAGSEVDILADGKLDYPNSLLKELDVVVASPHGALSQTPEKATARFLKAIDNPYVTLMGHLTGRIINRREGLSPDMKAIFAAVAERGIALEINANHHRLDLRDIHARAAADAGCKLSINTDAHGPADLDELRYGLLTARRAGLTRGDVVNCLDSKALKKWLASTRP